MVEMAVSLVGVVMFVFVMLKSWHWVTTTIVERQAVFQDTRWDAGQWATAGTPVDYERPPLELIPPGPGTSTFTTVPGGGIPPVVLPCDEAAPHYAEAERLDQEAEGKSAEAERLFQQAKTLNDQREALGRWLEELIDSERGLRAQSRQLGQQIRNLDRAIQGQDQQLNTLNAAIYASVTGLAAANSQLANPVAEPPIAEHATKAQERSAAAAPLTGLYGDEGDAAAELARLSGLIDLTDGQIADIRARQQADDVTLEQMQAFNAELERLRQQRNDQLLNLQPSFPALEGIRARIDVVDATLPSLDRQIADLDAPFADFGQGVIAQFNVEIDELQEEISAIEQQINAIDDQLAELAAEFESLMALLAGLPPDDPLVGAIQGQLAGLAAEAAALQGQREGLVSQLNALIAQRDALAAARDDAQGLLKQLAAERQARDETLIAREQLRGTDRFIAVGSRRVTHNDLIDRAEQERDVENQILALTEQINAVREQAEERSRQAAELQQQALNEINQGQLACGEEEFIP